MKLTFQKAALLNGINIVLKAVPSKTTMPILECILIDASTDVIKLTGNDMELVISEKSFASKAIFPFSRIFPSTFVSIPSSISLPVSLTTFVVC